jgi:hypothetical protein
MNCLTGVERGSIQGIVSKMIKAERVYFLFVMHIDDRGH